MKRSTILYVLVCLMLAMFVASKVVAEEPSAQLVVFETRMGKSAIRPDKVVAVWKAKYGKDCYYSRHQGKVIQLPDTMRDSIEKGLRNGNLTPVYNSCHIRLEGCSELFIIPMDVDEVIQRLGLPIRQE
jgi:hypothetical protein